MKSAFPRFAGWQQCLLAEFNLRSQKTRMDFLKVCLQPRLWGVSLPTWRWRQILFLCFVAPPLVGIHPIADEVVVEDEVRER